MASIMALALSLPCSNIKTRTADPHCPRYNDEVDWSSVFSALEFQISAINVTSALQTICRAAVFRPTSMRSPRTAARATIATRLSVL